MEPLDPILLQGDCLELMQDIPDGSVEMILTDPPYSSGGLFAGDRKTNTRMKYCDSGYNGAARAILKINNNQRGETRQDNHVGRHSERQIE